MEKELGDLIETLKKFDGLIVTGIRLHPFYIVFKLTSKRSFILIASQVAELSANLNTSLLAIQENGEVLYQLSINAENTPDAISTLVANLLSVVEVVENKNQLSVIRPITNDLGIPDLSLTTIKQMTAELKKRKNLLFALVWIEDSATSDISIEGNGESTQLIGLLSRGTHMAIDWADRNSKSGDSK